MRMIHRCGGFAAVLALAIAGGAQAQFPVQLEILHTTSSTISGIPAATIQSIFIPTLNHRGDILFSATVLNSGAPIRAANTLLINEGGVLSVAIQGNVSAPGTGQNFGDFIGISVINAHGEIVTRSQLLTGNLITGHGIFQISAEGPKLVAHSGMAAPGTEAGTFFPSFYGSYTDYGIDASGNTIFRGLLSGAPITSQNNDALWSFSGNTPLQIARETGPAPLGPGVIFRGNPANLNFQPVAFSAGGRLAFTAGLSGTGVTPANDDALFLGGLEGAQVIVREGDLAVGSGLPPNAVHTPRLTSRIAINDSEELLFTSSLSGTGIDTFNNLSVWKYSHGTLQLLLRENDPLAGAPAGVLLDATEFSQLGRGSAMNSQGDFILMIFLKGNGVGAANNFALYGDVAGERGLIVRQGAPVPNLPGITFASSNSNTTFMLNGRGDVFFRTAITGPGVSSSNDETLWFWTVEHGLQLIFREGASVIFTSGTSTVGATTLPGFSAGDDEATGIIFNNRGQLVLQTVVNGNNAILRATLQRPVNTEWQPVGFFGGQPRASSANYLVDTSSDPVAGGSAQSVTYSARSGFAGQLVDTVALEAFAGSEAIAETDQVQLNAGFAMDDGTLSLIHPTTARWVPKSGPILEVDATGLLTSGKVFSDSPAEVAVRLYGFQTTLSLSVLDTMQDNFEEYGSDGLPDNWQVANFGLPPNNRAAPGSDPDGNRQNNLMEYLAGTDPNDPASRFEVIIIPPLVEGQFSLQITPVVPGTKYTLRRNSSLDQASWDSIHTFSVPSSQDNYTVTDTAPFPSKSFYQVLLEKLPTQP